MAHVRMNVAGLLERSFARISKRPTRAYHETSDLHLPILLNQFLSVLAFG